MKKRIRDISSSKVFKNLVSVSFIQGLSLALPLITIPYLLRVLGADGFALVNIALAFTTYFVVLTDYGFNLMGTRLVALHQKEPKELNRIFSNMLYSQLLLTILAMLIFSAGIWLIPAYRENLPVFFATFGIVIGSTLFPTWYFQGREKFVPLHLINLVYRGLYTIGIFVLVKNEGDLLMVPILNSGTHIAGGLFGLGLMLSRYHLSFTGWRWKDITNFLKEGWNLFVSAISVTSIQQLPIIILGFFASATVVGYYAFADKILLLFRITTQMLSSVLYPRVIASAKASFEKMNHLLQRIEKTGLVPLLLVAGLLFVTPELLQNFLPGYYNPSLNYILKIWSLLPLAFFLKITAQQRLLAYDRTKIFAQATLTGAVVNASLLLILSAWLNYAGTAMAVLLTEVFLIFAMKYRSRHLLQKKS